jgi:hypothetical protein
LPVWRTSNFGMFSWVKSCDAVFSQIINRLCLIYDKRTRIQVFHTRPVPYRLPMIYTQNGRWRVPELNVPEGDKSPTACLACALYGSNPGCESVRQVTLGTGTSHQKLLRPLPATFHPKVSFIFGGGDNHHDL